MINQNLLLGDAGYNIQRSLRLRSSASAYLNRTPAAAGNRTTYTWSGWVKRGKLTADQGLFSVGTTAANSCGFVFTAADYLQFYTDNGTTSAISTNQVFRDTSSWYHIILVVDTTQATNTNRVKFYVNGSQVTVSGTYMSQNATSGFNNNVAHYIGAETPSPVSLFLDGYLTEVNFIDGQALTPSSFGQFDPLTGVWQPKKYTGTYGTNGFYLPFSDNTSATTLAYDKSGNGNNWTANNISTTAGSTYDSMTDVPTLTSPTAANYAVVSPIDMFVNTSGTTTNGNLTFNSPPSAGVDSATTGTIGAGSGSWYYEVTIGQGTNDTNAQIGILQNHTNNSFGSYSCALNFYTNGTTSGTYKNGSASQTGLTACTTNDILGVAYDATNLTMQFYRNGSAYGNQITGLTAGTYVPFVYAQTSGTGTRWILNFNFGQRPFSYTPPTGFKALNTFNLPDATIKAGNKHFDATLYTGTGTTNNVVNAGGFKPDFVWNKSRNQATSHILYDSVRGVGNYLVSNSTAVEGTQATSLISFNSNGFTVGGQDNGNAPSSSAVGWQWKANGSAVSNTAGSITSQVSANTTSGFSVVTFTTPASGNFTVGHGLGVAPSMFILKTRSGVDSWYVYNKNFATPTTGYLQLNSAAAVATSASLWGSTNPTSTVVTLGTGGGIAAGATGLLYCFSEVAGFSKFGSYTGNGSADGTFVYCGFRPKFVLLKRTDAISGWVMYDTARDTYNQMSAELYPHLSDAETSAGSLKIDHLSNGFKLRGTGAYGNANGGTYIYMAFAENPFKNSLAR